jgi:enamine deaminase RidA (YjgF/YER057c/UK114 family)
VAELEREAVNPWSWQDAYGYVQANEVKGAQRTLFCAGQCSMSADGEPMHAGDMEQQLRCAVENLETVLTKAGYTLDDVVRLNIYVTDVQAYFGAAHVLIEALGEKHPGVASTLLGVASLALPELMVEIEATAVQ